MPHVNNKKLYNNGAIKLQRIFTYVNAQFFIEYSPGVVVDVAADAVDDDAGWYCSFIMALMMML